MGVLTLVDGVDLDGGVDELGDELLSKVLWFDNAKVGESA